MPLGTMLTDLLHELLNKCPNPTGNQEFIFCHDPCGPASREILRGISKAGGEQNKPCIGRRRANLATGFKAADPWHPQVHEDDLGAQLATHLHGGLARRRFGNLARTLVQEVASKGSTERGAIVHDQHAGGGSICTGHRAILGGRSFLSGMPPEIVVPCPARDSMVSQPPMPFIRSNMFLNPCPCARAWSKPRPLSRTVNDSASSDPMMSIVTLVSCPLCFSAFCRASRQQK